MSAADSGGVNAAHEPNDYQERVLEVLKRGRDEGEPWGYVKPQQVAVEIGVPSQRIGEAIDALEAAGWVRQVEVDGQAIRGIYRFVADPREGDDGE